MGGEFTNKIIIAKKIKETKNNNAEKFRNRVKWQQKRKQMGLKWEDTDFNNQTTSINRILQYDKNKGEIFETSPKTKSPASVMLTESLFGCRRRI